MKYVNKLEDFEAQVMNGSNAYETMDNATSFTLPDLTPTSEEISGYAGLAGAFELIDWSNLGAPEFTMKFSRIPENGKFLINPEGTNVKCTWAESVVDENGVKSYESYTVYAIGTPKNVPGGEKKKGERPEVEIKIACRAYRFLKGSNEIVNYDPMNGKVVIFGNNYVDGVQNAIQGNK